MVLESRTYACEVCNTKYFASTDYDAAREKAEACEGRPFMFQEIPFGTVYKADISKVDKESDPSPYGDNRLCDLQERQLLDGASGGSGLLVIGSWSGSLRGANHIRNYDTWLITESEIRDQMWYQHHSSQSNIRVDQINHLAEKWSRSTALRNNQIEYATPEDVNRLREALGKMFVADSIGRGLHNLNRVLDGDTSLILPASPEGPGTLYIARVA